MSNPGDTHGTIEFRFWRKVKKGPINECWEWQGGLDKRGYGKMGEGPAKGRTLATHRVSFEIHFGPIPEGLFVCHHCDNPKCVNPAHLFAGDHQANIDDMVSKGRNFPGWRIMEHPRGEDHPCTKVSLQTCREIAAHKGNGMSQNSIAKKFGIGRSVVNEIFAGIHWSCRDQPIS